MLGKTGQALQCGREVESSCQHSGQLCGKGGGAEDSDAGPGLHGECCDPLVMSAQVREGPQAGPNPERKASHTGQVTVAASFGTSGKAMARARQRICRIERSETLEQDGWVSGQEWYRLPAVPALGGRGRRLLEHLDSFSSQIKIKRHWGCSSVRRPWIPSPKLKKKGKRA